MIEVDGRDIAQRGRSVVMGSGIGRRMGRREDDRTNDGKKEEQLGRSTRGVKM